MTREEKQKAIDALKISAPFMVVTQEEFNDYIQTRNKVMDWLEQEPTTKNDLGVDSISRQEAIDTIRQLYLDLASQKYVIDLLKVLPSVTPQEPRWIPVSERLPDTDDEVLCWYEYYHWSRGKVLPEYGIGSYLRETSAWSGEVANGKDVRVIAWMPLPKAYREDKE